MKDNLMMILGGLMLLLIVLVGVAKCTSGISGLDQSAAEKEAKLWANKMGMVDAAISCVKIDSDGDGYVSCTVLTKEGPQAIECTGSLTFNSGCRTPKFKINQ